MGGRMFGGGCPKSIIYAAATDRVREEAPAPVLYEDEGSSHFSQIEEMKMMKMVSAQER